MENKITIKTYRITVTGKIERSFTLDCASEEKAVSVAITRVLEEVGDPELLYPIETPLTISHTVEEVEYDELGLA